MKGLIVIVAISLFVLGIRNVGCAQSCCAKPCDMKTLALSSDFKAAHLPPLPLKYTAIKGSMIKFRTTDGIDGNAFYIPSDQATNKVLIIFHEWWGLNDYIKREAERWQKLLDGADVYAIDLFDGKVASVPDSASIYASNIDPKRADAIIDGLLRKIGQDGEVATLGWCMGGSWSFRATVLLKNQAAGCVMYYGFPEKEDKRIMPQADVLYMWGSQDKFILKPAIDSFATKIKATGHQFTMYSYDAPHAFANPSNPKYNADATAQAQEITLKFLKEKLQLP